MKDIISLNKDWLFYYGEATKDTDFASINCKAVDLPTPGTTLTVRTAETIMPEVPVGI